jgi:hypothetical protein
MDHTTVTYGGTTTVAVVNDWVVVDAANDAAGTEPVWVGAGVVGATVGSGDGVVEGVSLGVVVATGAGVETGASSADAGATTAASDRPAARVTAVRAARIFFMVFGCSLGEGFFGYAHEGSVRRRGGRRQIVWGTIGAEHSGGMFGG